MTMLSPPGAVPSAQTTITHRLPLTISTRRLNSRPPSSFFLLSSPRFAWDYPAIQCLDRLFSASSAHLVLYLPADISRLAAHDHCKKGFIHASALDNG